MAQEFDAVKFWLGPLCKHGHNWNGTGQSLRNKSGCKPCAECAAVSRARYYQSHRQERIELSKRIYRGNREEILKRDRERYWANREKRLQQMSDYGKRRRRERPDETRAYYARIRREWRRRTGGHKVHIKKWRQNNLDVCREYKRRSQCLRRARKRQNHTVPYTREQLTERFEQFNHQCAYCGQPANSVDHFIPISASGPDCLGNILPVCLTCNQIKSAADPYQWFSRQSFYSKKRWQYILDVLGKTQSTYNQLPLL